MFQTAALAAPAAAAPPPEAAAPEVKLEIRDLDVYYGAFRAVRASPPRSAPGR